MEGGVSWVRLCVWMLDWDDTLPFELDLIYMVSMIAVRCSSVTAGEVKMVVALSSMSGKSPLLPAQKERFHRAMVSGGIVISFGPGQCVSTSLSCVSSAMITHDLVSGRWAVIALQSTSFPLTLITVGRSPCDGVVIGNVVVGMNGLCGIVSWMVVACMA